VVGRRGRLPPVVLDVHEDLVASLPDRPWVPGSARPLARWLGARIEAWAERRLHLLLAESAYAGRFARPHPVVPNLPWLPSEPPRAGTKDRVVYVGRVSAGRGARELIHLGSLMKAADGPQLHLIGAVDRDMAAEIADADRKGLLRAHGYLPNAEAFELAGGAIAGLSLLHDLPNYRSSMPTKVVEYLALGLPAITTPLPEAQRLVTSTGAGEVVAFGDAQAAADAVLRYANDRDLAARAGAAGRKAVDEGLSWDAVAPRFVAHLRQFAGVGT
jgi:glycosyltransferase involved in cell wall biosynthesis